MTRNKKPRKTYRARSRAANTLALALHYAAKPLAADREEVLRVLRQSHQALREGCSVERDWSILAGAVATALTIERQRVVRGMHPHLVSAEAALLTVRERAMASGTWKPPELDFQEIDAIKEFVHLHQFQVEQLSRAEWLRAIHTTAAQVRSQGNRATLETAL